MKQSIRGVGRPLVLIALVAALAVELIRASGPMLDRSFNSGVVVAGLTALATYVAPGVIVALLTRLRAVTGKTVVTGVVVLALARLVIQSLDGSARFYLTLTGAAIAVGVATLVVAHVAGRYGAHVAGLGVTTGAVAASAISLLLGTWDAVWRSGVSGWLPTIVLTLSAVACAWMLRDDAAAPTPGRLWALGPYLAFTVMVTANPAYLASQLGLSLTVAGSAIALGLGAAAVLVLWSMPRQAPGGGYGGVSMPAWLRVIVFVVMTWVVLFPGLELGEPASPLLAPTYVLAIVALVAISTATLAAAWHRPDSATSPASSAAAASLGPAVSPDSPASAVSPASPASAASAGAGSRSELRAGLALAGSASAVGLGVILPLLVYQVDYDVPLGFPNALVILAAVIALGCAGLRRTRASTAVDERTLAPVVETTDVVKMAGAVGAVMLLGIVGALGNTLPQAQTGAAVASAPQSTQVAVLNWNLHFGVTQQPGVDMARMAQVINDSGAQIIALQEVSRGWVMGGAVDMATYLARATGSTMYTAPAADRQFVNVLLVDTSLGGAHDVIRTRLPYGDGPQWRSAVTGTVQIPGLTGPTPLVVTSTHLQHRDTNTATRLAQLEVLMSAEVATSPSAIIAGDFNAEPGWREIEFMTERGYVSAQDAGGVPSDLTWPAWDPKVRIDWIFGTGVSFSDVEVVPDGGSDHRGILAQVTLGAP